MLGTFQCVAKAAISDGSFKVFSGPLVRSSYMADMVNDEASLK